MKKAAIYVRVSTKDKGQDVNNQVFKLKDIIPNDHELIEIYSDDETGTKGRNTRAGFDKMFRDAQKRKFNTLIFWSLDRFTRQGPAMTFSYLNQLSNFGVNFISYMEPIINTENQLVRDIVIGVLSALAQWQAKKISENTKAALERKKDEAEKRGEVFKIGRLAHKKYDPFLKEKIENAIIRNESNIASFLNIHRSTVCRYRKELIKEGRI